MYYIGIDLGGTRIKIGLIEGETLIDKRILSAQSLHGLASHLSLIDEAISEMLQAHAVTAVKGVSMAFPGLVNPHAKKVLSTNQKYDDAASLDLGTYYRKKWDAAFFIDNDACMATIGEWKYGAGKSYTDLVMVTIGTGIGTSVILDGKLLRGKHFQAGCLGGHFVVNYNGKQCTCGNIGCVEAEASTWNIASFTQEHAAISSSSLKEKTVDFREIFHAAAQGDTVAAEVKQHCLDVWASGVVSYIHAYDPEIVILGGGILNSAQEIVPYVQDKINRYAWTPWGKVSVKVTELQDAAGILGAVYSLQNNI